MKFKKSDFGRLVGVDHFYVGFSREEIEDLESLAKLPFCTFSKVKSGRDSWQGVYWHTAHRHYFEMIECPQPGYYQFGLAISANQIQYFDPRWIKRFYKGAKRLSSLVRRIRGKPWFEAISAGDLENRPVFLWAMHYFFCPRSRKLPKQDDPSIVERFRELEIRANPKFLKALRETGYWVPFRSKKSGQTVKLEFKHKDRTSFVVKLHIDPKTEFTTFVSLTGQASPYRKPLPSMKRFQLSYRGGEVILRRK